LTQHPFATIISSLEAKYQKLPIGWDTGQKPEHALAVEQLKAFYLSENNERVLKIGEILTKHKFKGVVASIKKKYGAVPPGWEKQLSVLSGFGW
jgi:hypothetical protein